jgi:hypothetical protein
MRGSPVEMLSYPAMHGDGVPGILVDAMRQIFEMVASVLPLAHTTARKYAQIVNK